jgi:hypothetical protein
VTPRAKAAVLWGAIGALAFLAAHQAYLLADGAFLGVGPIAGVAVAVFVAAAASAYYLEGRLAAADRET